LISRFDFKVVLPDYGWRKAYSIIELRLGPIPAGSRHLNWEDVSECRDRIYRRLDNRGDRSIQRFCGRQLVLNDGTKELLIVAERFVTVDVGVAQLDQDRADVLVLSLN